MGKVLESPIVVRLKIPGAIVLSVAVFVGCGQKPDTRSETPASAPQKSNLTAIAESPRPGEKVCFACNGRGLAACRQTGCHGGKAECPGPCLKLTRGTWVHMNVAGHDPSELWQKFPNGRGGYSAWNQGHLGEVIAIQNGQAVNLGPCKTCGGTTRVTCPTCQGTGKQPCVICAGKKFVPAPWTPTDNPWLNSQPDLIRLKDGRVLFGRILLSQGDDRGIRLRNGKFLHVDAAEILTSPGTNR